MQSKAKGPTKAERDRWDRFKDIGCIVSRQLGYGFVPGDVQHMNDGMKRLGHAFTYCLSPWFHRGIPPEGMTVKEATEKIGPSMNHDARSFHKRFGTHKELLAFQNYLLTLDTIH